MNALAIGDIDRLGPPVLFVVGEMIERTKRRALEADRPALCSLKRYAEATAEANIARREGDRRRARRIEGLCHIHLVGLAEA